MGKNSRLPIAIPVLDQPGTWIEEPQFYPTTEVGVNSNMEVNDKN
jgi:hypothetical protein